MRIESCGKRIEDRVGQSRDLISCAAESSFHFHSTALPPEVTDALWFLTHLQQNSSPTPAPDPKPTMIDDWTVSVKPNTDPTIIKKHIEKMVEVSLFAPRHSPFLGGCYLYSSVLGRRGGGKWGAKGNYLFLSCLQLTWHDNCRLVTSGGIRHVTVLLFQLNLSLS